MRKGNVLESIHGQFTNIYPDRKEGEGDEQKGPWSFQGAKFQGTDGASIDVRFKNHPLIPQSWKNRSVVIRTVGNERAKGVEVDEWQGKKRLVLHTTVEFDWMQDGPPAGEARRDSQPRQESRAADPPPPRNDPPPREEQRRQDPPARTERQTGGGQAPSGEEKDAAAMQEARHFLGKMGLAYTMCYDTAAACAWRNFEMHGQITPSAAVGALATTFFIESAKKGMLGGLPFMDFVKRPVKGRKLSELTNLLTDEGIRIAVEKAKALQEALGEDRYDGADPDRPETWDRS